MITKFTTVSICCLLGNPVIVNCFAGDLGYTNMWSVVLEWDGGQYRTDDFDINTCVRDCDMRPIVSELYESN